MPLFDRIVMVDWSAAAVPTRGRDSIWIADALVSGGEPRTANPATREEAMQRLSELAGGAGRTLIGFDFAFGYPQGTAEPFGGCWRDVWRWLGTEARDGPANENDRFEVAARFNAHFPERDGPLWGLPSGRAVDGVRPTKFATHFRHPPERRRVERIVRNAQPTGKLAYPGSVGSQTLLGIARLERWRRDAALGSRTTIWPFQTGFADALASGIVIAEIFPSLHPVTERPHEVRDQAQVRTLASGYAELDRRDMLLDHLSGPDDAEAREAALREEGWIMSVRDAPMPLAA